MILGEYGTVGGLEEKILVDTAAKADVIIAQRW
jgi:hypothetical protein